MGLTEPNEHQDEYPERLGEEARRKIMVYCANIQWIIHSLRSGAASQEDEQQERYLCGQVKHVPKSG